MSDNNQTPQSSPFEIVTPNKPKKVSPKNFVILFMILVFVGISVFLGVYLVGQSQNLEESAAPATAMYLTPGSQTKTPGSTFSFTVNIDTSTNAVTGIDARLTFNPNAMQIVSLQQGSGVTNLNQTISNTYDNTAGTISYAIFTLDGSKAVQGSGIEVLKVNAQVAAGAASGSYNIAFDPASAASASQEGQNVLISKSQGTLIVAGGTGSNPTPTATATATATGTAQATATPTASATPNATATATATSNTATATATPVSTQSSPLPIPVSGTDWPTYLGMAVGIIVIIGSFMLAL
jgi:hypothetical protein